MSSNENCSQSPAVWTNLTSERGEHRPYVLVVDDDPAHRHLMELVADFLQIHIACVPDAEEGLTLLQQTNAFDLILLDCRMPGVDGFAFARRYREFEVTANRKRVPVIAVTGQCSLETQIRCNDAGMDDCVFKPFDLREFQAKIRSFLPKHKGRD